MLFEMLIPIHKFNAKHHDRGYVEARRKIDNLCGLIISERFTRKSAAREYENIERDYAKDEPDNLDFFRMIYKNRVRRLCDQFNAKGENEK